MPTVYGTLSRHLKLPLCPLALQDQPTDLLFVLTEKYKFFIIKYNAAKGEQLCCARW